MPSARVGKWYDQDRAVDQECKEHDERSQNSCRGPIQGTEHFAGHVLAPRVDVKVQITQGRISHLNVNMCRNVVGLVPPEGVDEEGADTMSESVQLEQRYCHVLAKAFDALGAEP